MRKITGNGLGCPVRPLSRSGVILGVILGVVYLILMIEMVMGGDSYEQRFWKWSGMLSGTTHWAWDVTMVILGVILEMILILLMILLNILYCGPCNVLLNVY